MRRTSEGLLLLLLATGFLMLAITGRLGWLVVMIGAAAYLIRGFTFLLRRPLLWSSRTWSLALLAYLPIFAWDGLVLSHSFLEASLHLVVLAGAARLFAPHSGRDDLLLGLLAFLEVLTAALLTVSGAFFILFLIFIVLLVATLVAFEMERAHAAAGCAPETVARIPRAGMLRFSLALSVMVAVCGALVFFLLPRTSLGGWSARPLGGGLTGFNDEVHLGAIANLQRSNRPIMHIRLIDSKPPLSPAAFEQIPWRGRGLTTFDGTRWFDPDTPAVFGSESGRIEVGVRAADGTAQLVRYQVSLEPIQSPVLFFPPRLLRAATHFPVLSWDRYTATLAGLGANGTGASYSGVSDLAVPSPQDLRLHGGWDRGHFPLRRYLQLPHDLDPRIPELARRVVAGVPDNNWERMQALTNYLKTHYAYSLQNLPQGAHPLSAFLFDPATGDCEYFASALAVMARTLDIPTRLVNGFLLGPYNPLTGEYLVRGRDAHTWVEAYFPTSYQGLRDGFGRAVWITFDATPDSAAATSLLPGSGMFLDAFSSAWQQWIVNYDWFRQARMAAFVQHDVDAAAGRAFTRTASAAEQAWSQLHTPSRSGAVWEFWASALLVVTICILGGLVLCRSGWALDGSRRRGRVGGDQAAVRRQAQAAYRRLLRHLQHCGLQHPPGQTPEELLAVVDGKHAPAELTVALAAFVRDYQALRFGSAPAGAARQLRPQLQHLRRLCRRSELT